MTPRDGTDRAAEPAPLAEPVGELYEYQPALLRDQLAEASTHWLRHTAASHMLNEAKMPMLSVSKILRHNDIRTTQRYTHKNKDDLHDQASKHVIDPS